MQIPYAPAILRIKCFDYYKNRDLIKGFIDDHLLVVFALTGPMVC